MPISQMDIIKSLGEAMAWLDREIEWKVPATELRHLCGRIGELFVAVLTNGQMANVVNQKGYDVVGRSGERISVKTTATEGFTSHVTFNVNTLREVDRIFILRINIEEREIETLLDKPVNEAMSLMSTESEGKMTIALSKLRAREPKRSDIDTISEVRYGDYAVRELENGSVEVEKFGALITPANPALRDIAFELNIGLLNGNGNALNTRQLGGLIIKSLKERQP